MANEVKILRVVTQLLTNKQHVSPGQTIEAENPLGFILMLREH